MESLTLNYSTAYFASVCMIGLGLGIGITVTLAMASIVYHALYDSVDRLIVKIFPRIHPED